MSLQQIEQLAKEHSDDRALLNARVQRLQAVLERAKRIHLRGIKGALGKAKDSRLRLQAAIEESRCEFTRPRTRVLHGIKVGLAKGKGALKYASEAEVVKLIKRHFADKADVLIKKKETPIRKALQQLPAADLKRIGCTITGTSDYIVIDPVDSELDKLVDALLKEPNGDSEEDDE